MKRFKLPPVFTSVRFMMTFAYICVTLAALIIMSSSILGALSEKLSENELSEAFMRANIIADSVSRGASFDESAKNGVGDSDIRCIITDTSSRALYDSNSDSGIVGKVFMRDAITRAANGEQNGDIVRSSADGHMLAAAVPVFSGDTVSGAVYLVKSADGFDSVMGSVALSLIIFSAVITVIIGILSFALSYVFTSPFDEFKAVAEAISGGDFSKRVKIRGRNEFAKTAETLNSMCARLEELEANRRKFVSDVSHELKTPMATIKVICDSLVATPDPDPAVVSEFLGDLSDEIDRLTRLIDRLLTLTRFDYSSARVSPEPVNFVIMIKRIISKLSPMAESRGISFSLTVSGNDPGDILLDYDKIWEAFYNIMDNAIKYSPDSAKVDVDIAFSAAAVTASVTDRGAGIPDSEKEHIFERFYRLDDSRARDTGGTGLGLAIARDAVLLHNGTIRVSDSDKGGSVFTVVLPLIPANKELPS